ncbi:MAG: DegT/DnrJ/EryC1/StrS family aminotransferase [Bacteroidales bacterium]|nr:DegT/DnrJ/EryC1/StrS family aminotransferase [Bacteroidales bacterium]
MRKIKMVDLRTQYLRHKAEIDHAIQDVIDSTTFIKGPAVKNFEQELAAYLGTGHCIACGNGTDALQAAFMAIELKPGDEVITTPFTFIATVEVIKLLGLRPVFVDVDPDTFNLNPGLIEPAVTEKTKAIVPVHLFGQAADMETILNLADQFGLKVIEDNAQALGTSYRFSTGQVKKTGAMGQIGCTSFFPSKNLGAFGDGGALFTDDPLLGKKIASLVNHGMIKKYHYEQVGFNSRLDTMQAAILRVKLRHFDGYNKARQAAAKAYDEGLSNLEGVKTPQRNSFSDHIFHQYTLQVSGGVRDDLKTHLHEQGIPSMIYYPVPLHMQEAYKDLGYGKGDFPIAEELCNKVLSLPMHTELDDDQLKYIVSSVKNFYNK